MTTFNNFAISLGGALDPRQHCASRLAYRNELAENTPGNEHAMYNHILIATDGSELAQKAATRGLALAKALGAKVIAIAPSRICSPRGPTAQYRRRR